METKANINFSNVGSDEEKITLSYYVVDCGSIESAQTIKDELDTVTKKHGSSQKE